MKTCLLVMIAGVLGATSWLEHTALAQSATYADMYMHDINGGIAAATIDGTNYFPLFTDGNMRASGSPVYYFATATEDGGGAARATIYSSTSADAVNTDGSTPDPVKATVAYVSQQRLGQSSFVTPPATQQQSIVPGAMTFYKNTRVDATPVAGPSLDLTAAVDFTNQKAFFHDHLGDALITKFLLGKYKGRVTASKGALYLWTNIEWSCNKDLESNLTTLYEAKNCSFKPKPFKGRFAFLYYFVVGINMTVPTGAPSFGNPLAMRDATSDDKRAKTFMLRLTQGSCGAGLGVQQMFQELLQPTPTAPESIIVTDPIYHHPGQPPELAPRLPLPNPTPKNHAETVVALKNEIAKLVAKIKNNGPLVYAGDKDNNDTNDVNVLDKKNAYDIDPHPHLDEAANFEFHEVSLDQLADFYSLPGTIHF